MSVAKLILLAHLPVMIIEGIITLFCVAFLARVKPELLGGIYGKGS
jgi:cobalt/nickel transport system permease protein